ncbi:MAG: hypothetical protein WBE92_08950, partial [Steroidobacteraceae bacterium]
YGQRRGLVTDVVEHDVDWEFAAITAAPEQLESRPHGAHARGLHIGASMLHVSLAQMTGYQYLGKRVAVAHG